jgi:endonuclease/exonuclease/phosphatase family metal-dependent hydrolase
VLQARRPGLGNALVIPERYELLSHRRGWYVASHLLGVADGLLRWARRRAQPNWRQFGELRMWIEARLRDRAAGRDFTVLNTHLSVEASLKVTQGREIVRRTHAAAARGPVILAGDLNVPVENAAGRDLEVASLLTGLRDMGSSPPPRASSRSAREYGPATRCSFLAAPTPRPSATTIPRTTSCATRR